MENLSEAKEFIRHISILSGAIIKKYFRTKIDVNEKQDLSPVTIADKKAEELMREEIMKNFPDHGIIGEEFGTHNENAKYKWILDPIDGTKSFICGTVEFGTLIALTENNRPILGGFNQPILNEFLLGDNRICTLNGEKVSVRNTYDLSNVVLLTTDHKNIKQYQDINKFNKLIDKVKLYRNWGDCYGYYLLATGFADIMIDPIMSIWDLMSLIPIVNGAGGVITDYHGNDAATGNSIIASTSEKLHKEILSILK